MAKKKIGSITPIWNQELWIKPHFEMLSKLDRNVVLLQKQPLPNYHTEHGYSSQPDLSEKLLRKYFPNVEIYDSHFPEGQEFSAELYNEGLRLMRDCDVVFRLDPDMVFSDECWDHLLDYIQNVDADAYRMDFHNDSVNYYITGDFNHGLKDAEEFDPLAVNPQYEFTGVLDYPGKSDIIKFPGFFCHHFRGWNKPKSTPPDWWMWPSSFELVEQYGNKGKWYECPKEIRDKLEPWLTELKELKRHE